MNFKYLVLFSILYVPFRTQAQINIPRICPSSTIQQTIGLTDFEVDYSRPAKRGRVLVNGLIPYGRIWRVGANESTKFKVSHDILVNGDTLKAGVYALYAFPDKEKWDIVFHSDTSHWGDGRDAYDPSKDALRVTSNMYYENDNVENFRIDFQNLDHNSGTMVWAWGTFRISVECTVFTDDYVMKDIEKQVLENPNALTFYQAARYFQEQEKESELALEYLDEAESIEGATYYIYRVRALVLAKLEEYEKAIQSAQTSKELAQKEGKDEFVRLNEGYILEWKKQLRSDH
jgi:tetratricopeptide (TPR) repeat protein